MPKIDRRTFAELVASTVLGFSLPVTAAATKLDGLSPVMAARRHAMHAALAEGDADAVGRRDRARRAVAAVGAVQRRRQAVLLR